MDSLPSCEADFTVEYLNKVLERFKEITEVTIKVPKTHGGMSVVRKVFLKYNEETEGLNPTTIIAKYSLKASENMMNQTVEGTDIMRHGELYKREVMLNNYFNGRELIPNIYYSKVNENQEFVMLMEDCSTENDVKEGVSNTVQNVMSRDKILIVMKDLGKLHAEFYHENDKTRLQTTRGILTGNQDKFFAEKGLQKLPEYVQFMYYTMNHVKFVSCLDVDNFASYTDNALQSLAKIVQSYWDEAYEFILSINYSTLKGYDRFDIPGKIKEIQESGMSIEKCWFDAFKMLTEEAPLTIVHGDFRADNILVKHGKMKLIDWQCTSLGCGLIDVVSLLYHSVDLVDLPELEEIALTEYVNALQANNCCLLTLEDSKKWFSYALWYEFKMTIYFAKFFSSMKVGTTKIGVEYSEMEKLMIKRVAGTIYGIHKYCLKR